MSAEKSKKVGRSGSISLDEVAKETGEVIRALDEGSFALTEAYQKITHYYLQPYETAADAAWKMVTFNYRQRAAAELGTLVRLAVVSPTVVTPDMVELVQQANVPPVTHDSFFTRFDVVKVI